MQSHPDTMQPDTVQSHPDTVQSDSDTVQPDTAQSHPDTIQLPGPLPGIQIPFIYIWQYPPPPRLILLALTPDDYRSEQHRRSHMLEWRKWVDKITTAQGLDKHACLIALTDEVRLAEGLSAEFTLHERLRQQMTLAHQMDKTCKIQLFTHEEIKTFAFRRPWDRLMWEKVISAIASCMPVDIKVDFVGPSNITYTGKKIHVVFVFVTQALACYVVVTVLNPWKGIGYSMATPGIEETSLQALGAVISHHMRAAVPDVQFDTLIPEYRESMEISLLSGAINVIGTYQPKTRLLSTAYGICSALCLSQNEMLRSD